MSETGAELSPTTSGSTSEGTESGEQQREFIDLSNLDLEEEQEGFDPDADAFALPPPMDDGVYIGRVVFAAKEADKRWERKHDKNNSDQWWLETQLMCVVEDEENKFHGRYAFDRRFVNTKLDRNNTTRIAGVLRALGLRPPSGHAAQAKALTDAIDAGTELAEIPHRLGGAALGQGCEERDPRDGAEEVPPARGWILQAVYSGER
jgi:hypothetical protein